MLLKAEGVISAGLSADIIVIIRETPEWDVRWLLAAGGRPSCFNGIKTQPIMSDAKFMHGQMAYHGVKTCR